MSNINSNDDVIDSRDIIEAMENYESEVEDVEMELDSAESQLSDLEDELSELDDKKDKDQIEDLESKVEDLEAEIRDFQNQISEINEELKPLQELNSEGENYASDWEHGATLINEAYFTEYAEETAKDCGAIGESADWIVIDWEATAENMKMDYTQIEFECTTFFVRD